LSRFARVLVTSHSLVLFLVKEIRNKINPNRSIRLLLMVLPSPFNYTFKIKYLRTISFIFQVVTRCMPTSLAENTKNM